MPNHRSPPSSLPSSFRRSSREQYRPDLLPYCHQAFQRWLRVPYDQKEPEACPFSRRVNAQVGRSAIRPPRRVLDFDRLAGQFLPRLLLVVGEQGLDLGHVLLLRRGPLVPSVRALLLAGVLVDRSRERTPCRLDDLTDLRLLVVGELQPVVDGGIGEGLDP